MGMLPGCNIIPGSTSKLMPDVVVETKDGKFIVGEVVSPGQTVRSQQRKLDRIEKERPGQIDRTELDDTNARDAQSGDKQRNCTGDCDDGGR